MSEKTTPDQEPEDISLGYYGRYETMPVPTALGKYLDLMIQGQETFDYNPDKMQIMNTVANATDAQINAWAAGKAKVKDLKTIDLYVGLAKEYRAHAQTELGVESKPLTIN